MNLKSFWFINGSSSESRSVNLWKFDSNFWSNLMNYYRFLPVLVQIESEERRGNVVHGGTYIFIYRILICMQLWSSSLRQVKFPKAIVSTWLWRCKTWFSSMKWLELRVWFQSWMGLECTAVGRRYWWYWKWSKVLPPWWYVLWWKVLNREILNNAL